MSSGQWIFWKCIPCWMLNAEILYAYCKNWLNAKGLSWWWWARWVSNMSNEQMLLGNSVHVQHMMETDVFHFIAQLMWSSLSTEHLIYQRLYTALSSKKKKKKKTFRKKGDRPTFCSGFTQTLKTGNRIFPFIKITKIYNSITNRFVYSSTCH